MLVTCQGDVCVSYRLSCSTLQESTAVVRPVDAYPLVELVGFVWCAAFGEGDARYGPCGFDGGDVFAGCHGAAPVVGVEAFGEGGGLGECCAEEGV